MSQATQSLLAFAMFLWALLGLALGGIALHLAKRWKVKLSINFSMSLLQTGMFYGPLNVLAIWIVWDMAREQRK